MTGDAALAVRASLPLLPLPPPLAPAMVVGARVGAGAGKRWGRGVGAGTGPWVGARVATAAVAGLKVATAGRLVLTEAWKAALAREDRTDEARAAGDAALAALRLTTTSKDTAQS
jgi:hypothetical protein